MSAFVCIFHRDGSGVDPRRLRRLAEPLADDGDETTVHCDGPLGVAVRHRGRAGVRVDRQSGAVSAMVGSLDAVVADPAAGTVCITRDRLGGHAVYYSLDARWLIAASDPAAILRHETVSDDLDEGSVARFLGYRSGQPAASFFRHVRQLPPAHRLLVTGSGESVEQTWRFRRLPEAGDRPPEEIAADFRRRLEVAVADAMAGLEARRVAVSLSGGLDSTAVAALAPRGVRAFSWSFETTPEADERPRIAAAARHLGLPVTWIPTAGLHPLGDDFAERFVHVGSPVVNPFAALKCRLYAAARDDGCVRVLVGDGGDAPYAARHEWLHDLLAQRQPGALRSLAVTLGRAARGDRSARRALRRLVPLEALRRTLRRDPPWLTAEGRAVLPPPTLSPILPPGPRASRHELSVGAPHTELESEERRLAARCGVERGNPFWTPRVLESAIQLPAWWYHRDGRDKPLSRLAFRGLLPEEVLEGGRSGLLGSFFLRGLELRRDELRESVFRHPRSDWQRYVRRGWVEPYLETTDSIAFGHTVLWRVISYELWHRRLLGRR